MLFSGSSPSKCPSLICPPNQDSENPTSTSSWHSVESSFFLLCVFGFLFLRRQNKKKTVFWCYSRRGGAEIIVLEKYPKSSVHLTTWRNHRFGERVREIESWNQLAMLYIIGLGLGNEQDITLKGLEAVRKCQKVYMEAYTSLLSFGLSTHGLSNLVRIHISSLFLSISTSLS